MASDIISVREFRKGYFVFREGDQANAAYLVKNGVIEITRLHETGEPQVIGYAGPGQVFGEGVFMAEMRRPNSARVHEKATCIGIDRRKLAASLEESDPFVKALYKLLSGNMQSMIDKGANLECLLEDLSVIENASMD